LNMEWHQDTLVLTCKEATYQIARDVVEQSKEFCWDIPADGAVYHPTGTFAFISKDAMRQLQDTGTFTYDSITWRKMDEDGRAIHVKADTDHTEMWISTAEDLPLVLKMKGNPLGIDWEIKDY